MSAGSTGVNASIQNRIEASMKRFRTEGRWECVFLFSSEGLLLAKNGTSEGFGEEALLEFAFSLIQTVRLLGDGQPVKDVWLRGQQGRALAFRYFDAWGESMVLAAVVSGRKGYRRALTEVISRIRAANPV